ncbi:hypothetical protein EVAR_14274_1 [Eumeta japonica]|uniref:Uncharacterized protein n=1 Tax=Eumeta variegata TaxID=151549 RepID=A0A4C1WB87_EUMVA|nr:hypothetical protein EVAR_14274_1 [Eumeta japonica]
MMVYPLTPPLDLRLTGKTSRFGPPKWGHHHWIRRGRIPDEKTPGYEATNKSSVPHLRPKRKVVDDPRTNSDPAMIESSPSKRCRASPAA